MKPPAALLRDIIHMDCLYSFHYYEFAKDFVFSGERHDYWELVYVDRGDIEVMAGDTGYTLHQGEMIFHMPDEFHSLWANEKVSPSIVVISFDCESPAMSFFERRMLLLSDGERALIADMLRETSAVFADPVTDKSVTELRVRDDSDTASEQLIRSALETLLVRLMRKDAAIRRNDRLSTAMKQRSDKALLGRLDEYARDNARRAVSLGELCHHMALGRSQLSKLTQTAHGMGATEYCRHVRLEQAKTLLRGGEYTITEVSSLMGYESIHAFTRQFKKSVGVSPTHYARSIRE